jgi:hypothetical protein
VGVDPDSTPAINGASRDGPNADRPSCTPTRGTSISGSAATCTYRRGITARIARIGIESADRLRRHRWVVERTHGGRLSSKRLALR